MEGLTYGWKKAIKHYHFHLSFRQLSLCGKAAYNPSEWKKIEFFSDIEIEPDMKICQECYSLRQKDAKHEIIEEHKKSKSLDGYILEKRGCHEVGCAVVGYAYVPSKGEEKQHFCLKHNLRVQETIRKEKELAA